VFYTSAIHTNDWPPSHTSDHVFQNRYAADTVQNRRLGKGGTMTVEDQKIEVDTRFKYLGTVINYINDETE